MTPAREDPRNPSPDVEPIDPLGRVDDAVAPPPPIPLSEVGDLFAALDKAVRSQRLYQPNNPVYQGFIKGVEAAFARLWPRLTSLTAAIEENGFRWYGQSFAGGGGEGRESLPFLFYKDGIRYITFLPGFEHEVLKFLNAVNRARSPDQRAEDDMVTLLWQQEFASFRYSYVDALSEGLQIPQSRVPQLAGLELTLVPDGAAEAPTAGERPDRPPQSRPPAVEAGAPTVAGLINRDEFEETLYFLDARELQKLRVEVEREWNRDVKSDVLNALFDRLEQGLPQWRTEILRILRQMLPVFLGAGDLRSASRVLIELNAMLDGGTLAQEHKEAVEDLFRELSEPAVLTQLLRSLEDGSIAPSGEDLGVFLQHLGPAAMPVLLAAIERNVAGALQERLRGAMEGLAAAHRQRLLELLRHDDTDVVRGAARLTGQLGMNEAAASLGDLLQRSDATVRRAAVEALVRIRSAVALEALQRSLGDVDREVRIAAARGIGVLRYAPARPRLEEMLESRNLRDADLTEKIAFFEAYGSVASADSVALLDRMLNGRRLLGKDQPEIRACAAMALGRMGSPAARAALKKSDDDNNPMVRNAVMKALRQGTAS
jgi:hypothetical protein